MQAGIYKDQKSWYRDTDFPAIERKDGHKEWWQNGNLHRNGNLPAIEKGNNTFNESNQWWKNGLLHRDGNLPAIEFKNGTKEWWKNGKRHRSKGFPAIVRGNIWRTTHRVNGPAIITEKQTDWYVYGENISLKKGLAYVVL